MSSKTVTPPPGARVRSLSVPLRPDHPSLSTPSITTTSSLFAPMAAANDIATPTPAHFPARLRPRIPILPSPPHPQQIESLSFDYLDVLYAKYPPPSPQDGGVTLHATITTVVPGTKTALAQSLTSSGVAHAIQRRGDETIVTVRGPSETILLEALVKGTEAVLRYLRKEGMAKYESVSYRLIPPHELNGKAPMRIPFGSIILTTPPPYRNLRATSSGTLYEDKVAPGPVSPLLQRTKDYLGKTSSALHLAAAYTPLGRVGMLLNPYVGVADAVAQAAAKATTPKKQTKGQVYEAQLALEHVAPVGREDGNSPDEHHIALLELEQKEDLLDKHIRLAEKEAILVEKRAITAEKSRAARRRELDFEEEVERRLLEIEHLRRRRTRSA